MIDLVPFEKFSWRLNGLTRRTVERMSAKGKFPAYLRWSAYSEPLWSLAAVENWIAEKLAPLEA
ncbi:MAG: hypothetical protein DI624_04530 [Brevundimonas sp.]|uniref:helix-turn-helix transcriptional regulator n=1 Tax=Brevundimonas sp. TaxID=1871086 RepID=UPI000DB5C9C6|nr:hypothetical protein [Brevundimonas sp.]PZT99700.1 MAG: hypothetical protein DI624_04530 [Brevundimonas sp.]